MKRKLADMSVKQTILKVLTGLRSYHIGYITQFNHNCFRSTGSLSYSRLLA